MAIVPVGPEVKSQELNDNFAELNAQLADIALNVKSFGAVGDGINDDTAAIQDTVDAVRLAGGGTVFFPAGRYRITASIIIPSGVTVLEGVGESSIITGEVDLIKANEINTDFTLSHIKINPQGAADGLIYVNASMAGRLMLIDTVTFENNGPDGGSGSGVLLRAETVHATRIVNSRFVYGKIGIVGIGVVNFIVSGCYFSGRKSGGITGQEWAMKFTKDSYPIEGIRISNSNIIDWQGGIYAEEVLDMVVNDCMIDQNDTLMVLDSCGPARIFDNYFGSRITSDPCIKLKTSIKTSSYIKIHGNTFSCNNFSSYAIDICPDADDINTCEYTTITDNSLIGWIAFGLRYNPAKMIYSQIMNNSIPGGLNKITPTLGVGSNNYVLDNQGGTGGLGSIFTNFSSKQRCYVNSVVISVVGGSPDEDIDVDVSSIGFSAKPTVGFISCASHHNIVGSYSYDPSSATSARFKISHRLNSNLTPGTHRFSVLLFQ